MSRIVESIAGLPMPAKVAGAAVLVVGAGGMFAAFGGSSTALIVVVAGLVVIGGLLMAYMFLLKMLQKRKAAPMEKSIAGNAAAAPTGITEPARRARVDDLRKNFDTGVEKFKAAGKNLYALPWYLLVGEPGSGKTEAIRHCNVGFPPGLQDQLQGVGGTLNMNWWFTNYAIILDTAGRLMFEEVEPGSTSEWQEFLKLLKKNRPNCPVNGMLLVIPAESLIRDTAESLERKGGKIASQLDSIQRILGVRFPVFVIITKCDLINGFREFFDELSDPALQHQILGWSNPAPLDTAFNPELVEQHLKTVQERLTRRRLGLMIDPVNTEDPRARRSDQVDALFAFPDAMIKIAPRLRRYLEMIFVAGEWSQKPLFLRGIYFTSSMREGSALDQELAEAFGVPVESLPEGRVWERDRSYFLRDLFMQKVFREKGLVTRAVNTSKHQRMRRNIVLATLTIGMLVVGAFTFYGARSLNSTIVTPSVFWEKTSQVYLADANVERPPLVPSVQLLPIVSRAAAGDKDFKYRGGEGTDAVPLEGLPVDTEKRTRAGMAGVLRDQAKLEIGVPWVFRPVAAVLGDRSGSLAETQRTQAARVVFEGSVLRPLVDAAKVNLDRDSSDAVWSTEATGALAQLLRLEMANLPKNSTAQLVELEPLLRYALRGNDDFAKKNAASDLKVIDESYRSLYSISGGSWPPESMTGSNRVALTKGLESFTKSWTDASSAAGPAAEYLTIKRLADALADFGRAESELWALARAPQNYEQNSADWRTKYAAVKAAAERIEKDVTSLKGRTVKVAFTDELEKYRTEARKQHDMLLKELAALVDAEGKPTALAKVESSSAGGGDLAARVDALTAARRLLTTSSESLGKDSKEIADLKARLDELDALYINNPADPAYAARYRMYQLADQRLAPAPAAAQPKPGETRVALKAIDENTAADARKLETELRPRPGADSLVARYNEAQKSAQTVSTAMVEVGNLKRRADVVGAFLGAARGSVADAVAGAASADAALVPARPDVPMTARKPSFDARYAPKPAAMVLGDCLAVRALLRGNAPAAPAGSAAAPSVLGAAELRQRFTPIGEDALGYFRAYCTYWAGGIADDLVVTQGSNWSDFAGQLAQTGRVDVINQALEAVHRVALSASEELTAVVDPAALDKPSGEAYDALTRLTAQAKTTLASQAFIARADRVLNNWRGLGNEGGAARRLLLNKLQGPTGVQDHLLLTQGELKDADFVQRFYRDITYKALKSLAADSAGGVAQAIAQLKSTLKFPLAKPAAALGPEMTLAELASLKSAFDQVKSAVGSGPGAAGAPAVAQVNDRDINDELTRLSARDAITDSDREFIERIGKMLAALPTSASDRQRVTITFIEKAPKPGNLPIAEIIPIAALQPNGGTGKRVGIYGVKDAELATTSSPDEPLVLSFQAQNNTQLAALDIPSRWPAMWLIDRFNGRPRESRKTWEVEVELPVPDGAGNMKTGSIWLKLDFEKELPEMPWFK